MAKKVLVVDDEKLIVKGIRFSLEQDGMEVECAYDGEAALRLASDNEYDLILLDIMLPKMDGFEVCQHIREFSSVPIVMLTAKGDDMDKILGLEYGADDYIIKPYTLSVLKMHMEAVLKRLGYGQDVLYAGNIRIEINAKKVYMEDKYIETTPKEFELLYILVRNSIKQMNILSTDD